MATLTSAQMLAVVQAGGTVVWQGQIIATAAQVPSDAAIAAATAANSPNEPVVAPDLTASGPLAVTDGVVTLPLGRGQGTWGGQIVASGSALASVLAFEYSVDGGVTYTATNVRSSAFSSGVGQSLALTGTAQTVRFRGSCSGWTHVRVHCANYHAGDTIAVSLAASTATDVPTGIAQDGTDSTDGNATQATAGVGIRGWLSTLVSLLRAGTAKLTSGGIFNSSLPTLTNGQRGDLQLDAAGNLRVTQGAQIEGENATYHRMMTGRSYNPIAISTATTTTAKSGAGLVGRLIAQGGTLGTVTIYDNTAGSGIVLLATITPLQGQILLEDVPFGTGLTIVTGSATVINGGYL